MARLLAEIAWAHSGDKSDSVNLGVVARSEADYATLLREVTAERVRRHFDDILLGDVQRFELPNLRAINLVLTRVLDGGPMRSLRLDAQGKTLGDALMLMPISADPTDPSL